MNAVTLSAAEKHQSREKQFDWPLCYEAENWALARLDDFLRRNSFALELSRRMREETGTLFLDWVDHLVLSSDQEQTIRKLGFVPDPLGETVPTETAFWHPEAMLPRILLHSRLRGDKSHAAIRADSIPEFMAVHGITETPEGKPLGDYRRVLVNEQGATQFHAVERRGYRGYLTDAPQPGEAERILSAFELWKTRQRNFNDDEKGFDQTLALLDQIIDLVGRDMACHIVFAEERAYWERRNRAAEIQKRRQDSLGLGWANHDHHTFRSSRKLFRHLMRALEMLGFERRERYYAGAQAGWGAQILEQPVEGIVAFCDVDLQPEETEIDFSRQPLPEAPKLGTIGLWVGLHGESFLQAGMHHLECRFDYGLLREQLSTAGVETMKPFSDFPFLKQAFTEGERWPVSRERAERLLCDKLITQAQFEEFTTRGAIGSHLENLQRKGGFKGFNQKSVSVIIEATDPRKQSAVHQHA